MFLKLVAISFLTGFCTCHKSLSFVVDTSGSMEVEIDVIKANTETLLKSIDRSDITEYMVVPFNNPDLGSPLVSSNPTLFLESVNSLTSIGGQHECPEVSLSGIEMALQQSKPESFIFLFTDAYAKDTEKLEVVSNLCKSTRSKVVIFLSGSCPSVADKPVGSVEVYYDVAKACSGSMLRFNYYNLKKAFQLMKDLINTEYNEVTNIERFREFNQIPLSVGEFSKDIVISVSGDNPLMRVINSEGRIMHVEGIFDTRLALVSRLRNLPVGEYRLNVRCYGLTSVTIYKRSDFPYQIGFSIATPRSLKETSSRPVPGRTSNVIVSASKDCSIKFESIEIQMIANEEKKNLVLEVLNEGLGLYQSSTFFYPDKAFRILVKGRDKQTYKEFLSMTKIIEPQQMATDVQSLAPNIETLGPASTLVEYNSEASLACKVHGYPQPNITWQNSYGEILQSETFLLEIPKVFISYVKIDTTSNNTIECRAENDVDRVSERIDVFVHRPYSFNVIQTPSDAAIRYDTEEELYCQIEAYPEATTKWYFKGELLEESKLYSIDSNKGGLIIREMSLEQVGEYTCEASNEIERKTFSAFVNVTGLEIPTVTLRESELILKPGDWTEVECFTRGVPRPNITWQYKSDSDYGFSSLPEGVTLSDDKKLKLSPVKMEHIGTYRCEAANVMGTGSADVSIKIHYAPIIKNFDTMTLTVVEGDLVELPCEVDAIPEPKVWWEMSKGDVVVPLDNRHTDTDGQYSHRFVANSKDTGDYRCIAENSVGRTQESLTVNVLVEPYIEATNATVFARVGSSIVLPCKVLNGNPEPSLRWEFISSDSTITVLQNTSRHGLSLQNVSKAQEGIYRCIAKNSLNTDSIRMSLRVI